MSDLKKELAIDLPVYTPRLTEDTHAGEITQVLDGGVVVKNKGIDVFFDFDKMWLYKKMPAVGDYLIYRSNGEFDILTKASMFANYVPLLEI